MVSLPFNSKSKGAALNQTKQLITLGTTTLVTRDNTHNNDQALRSSPHSFHLEKGAFFSKDSDTVANPSLREFGEGGLFLSNR